MADNAISAPDPGEQQPTPGQPQMPPPQPPPPPPPPTHSRSTGIFGKLTANKGFLIGGAGVAVVAVVVILVFATGIIGGGNGGGGGGNISDPKDVILADAPWLMVQDISAILSAEFPEGIPQQMTRFETPFNMPSGIDLEDAESWKDEWRDVFANNMPDWMAEAFTLDEVTYAMAHGLTGTAGSGNSGIIIFGNFDFASVRAALEDAGLDDSEYRDFETWDDDAITLLEDNGVIIYGRDFVQPFLRALDRGVGFADDTSGLKLLMEKREQALIFQGGANCSDSAFFRVGLRRCEALMETVDGGGVYESEISGTYLFRDVRSAEGGLGDIEEYIYRESGHDADIEQIETDGEFVTYKVTIHEDYDPPESATATAVPTNTPAATAAPTAMAPAPVALAEGWEVLQDFILEDTTFVVIVNTAAILASEDLPGTLYQMFGYRGDRGEWKERWKEESESELLNESVGTIVIDDITYMLAQHTADTESSGWLLTGNFEFADIRDSLDDELEESDKYRSFEVWGGPGITLVEEKGIIILGDETDETVEGVLTALDTGRGSLAAVTEYSRVGWELKRALEKAGEEMMTTTGIRHCHDRALFPQTLNVGSITIGPLGGCEAAAWTVKSGDFDATNISLVYVFTDEYSAESGMDYIREAIFDSGEDVEINQIETEGYMVAFEITIYH